jgi:hypothetical protein
MRTREIPRGYQVNYWNRSREGDHEQGYEGADAWSHAIPRSARSEE